MNRDNGQSQEAQRVRQESEFIKRVEDSAQVHELCDDDGGARFVEYLDEEIGRKQKQLTVSMWVCVGIAVWSAFIITLLAVGVANWITIVPNLLLMAWTTWFITRDIQSLRRDISRLKQQRKRAAGRQKIMSRISQFGEFLRQMRAQIEEDAGDDDDDE